VKLRYGYAVAKEVGTKETIELKKFASDAKGVVSRRFAAEIIESRLEEIFDLVNSELKSMQKFAELPGGVVLVGGGAKLPGITDLAKQEMRLSAQIGCTLSEDWGAEGGAFKELLEDPEYVSAFGLVLWAMEGEGWGKKGAAPDFGLRKLFRYFAP
jgi:cell division protein FtsA